MNRRAGLVTLVVALLTTRPMANASDSRDTADGNQFAASPYDGTDAEHLDANAAPWFAANSPVVDKEVRSAKTRELARVPFALMAPPLPSVSLVVPSATLRFVAPAAPVLLANVSPGSTDTQYSIARVEFLDDGEIIGSVEALNAPPTGYAFVWTNATPGAHSVAARAVDSAGNFKTSGAITLYVESTTTNPQVRVTAPATGTIVTPFDTVQLNAETTAGQRSIQRVELLAGATVIATAWAPPYTGTWSNPPAGEYMITARAFDDSGAVTGSAATYIRVLADRRPVAVVVTSPSQASHFSAGTPVVLVANAVAPDERIDVVDFFANGSRLGTGSSAATDTPGEYRYQWIDAAPGDYAVTAVARAPSGMSTTSRPLHMAIAADAPPTISLVSPANGAVVALGQSIALSASATSPVALDRIDFFADGRQIASVAATAGSTAFTASFAWAGATPGGHSLSATVLAASGTSVTSVPVNVTVAAPTLPSISMTAPLAGATYGGGQPIRMTVQANAPDSGISRVDFFSDGILLGSVPVTGGPPTLTANFSATGLTTGSHVLAANVVAINGASATSGNVAINVADLSIVLTSPVSGQTYQIPDDIYLAATPSVSGGTVARIDFYIDGQLSGTVGSAPYTYTWHGAAIGPHSIFAQATGHEGVVAQSPPVTVRVIDTASLAVDAGIDGSVVNDDTVTVSGTVQAGANSVVSVNGVLALLDSQGHFLANTVPLHSGGNSVTVTLNTLGGDPIVRTLGLQSSGAAGFAVALDASQGITPLNTALTITDRGDVPFQRIAIAYDDSDTPDQVLTGLPDGTVTLSLTYAAVGMHTIRVTVYDADNEVVYLARRRVLVLDPMAYASIALNTYNGMVAQLQAGNTTRALMAVTEGSRAKYQDVFVRLGATLSQVARSVGTVRSVTVTENYADIVLTRDKNGGTYAYHVRLIQDGDGVWRVDSM